MCMTVRSKKASLNISCGIMFTFRLIPLAKVWTSFSPSYGSNGTTAVLQQLLYIDLRPSCQSRDVPV